jgi:hypothetical protein
MSAAMQRWRTWLWWLLPLAAFALILALETDWGRGLHRIPEAAVPVDPKPVAIVLIPEYAIEGGMEGHGETVSRTLFNPTRRPAPPVASEGRRSLARGQYVLTGTAMAGDRHIAFLKEVNGGRSRVVRQGEELNGMKVTAVTADRVRLVVGDESEDLILKAAPGPKTTTQPPPMAAAPAPQPGAAGMTGVVQGGMPGAAAPANAGDLQTVPAGRRVMPGGNGVSPTAPATTVPVAPAAPVATPATPAAAGSTQPASADPAWNEAYERMRRRNPATPPSN